MDTLNPQESEHLIRLAEILVLGVVAILIIFFVVRPLINRAFPAPEIQPDTFINNYHYNTPEPELKTRKEIIQSLEMDRHLDYVSSLKSVSSTYKSYLGTKKLLEFSSET